MKLTTSLLAIFLLASCESDKKHPVAAQPINPAKAALSLTPATPKKKGPCCSAHETPEAGEISDESVYQLDSVWKEDTGEDLRLSSLRGKIQVVTMGYTTCQFACPRLLADMLAIQDKIPDDLKDKVGFVFLSIDPSTDTPSQLTTYRKNSELNPEQWTLLTADTPTVQELAVLLGVQYRKTSNKDYAHSNIITVLNKKGEIIHRQVGLGIDPTATIKAITAE